MEIATRVHHHDHRPIAQQVVHMATAIHVHLPIVRHAQAKVALMEIVTPVHRRIAPHAQVKAVPMVTAIRVHHHDHLRIARHAQVKAVPTATVIPVHQQIVHAEAILSVAIVQKLAMIAAIVRLRALANAVVVQIAPAAGLLMIAKNVHVAG